MRTETRECQLAKVKESGKNFIRLWTAAMSLSRFWMQETLKELDHWLWRNTWKRTVPINTWCFWSIRLTWFQCGTWKSGYNTCLSNTQLLHIRPQSLILSERGHWSTYSDSLISSIEIRKISVLDLSDILMWESQVSSTLFWKRKFVEQPQFQDKQESGNTLH